MPASPPAEGLVVVDKPGGWTSHDVVARMRRIAGTRKVGHAGTLDPMATGVLVVGIGRATRLLGHIAAADKSYDATIRLGQSTVTDDAEGDVVGSASAALVGEDDIRAAIAGFVGDIDQVPSAVSAVKVDGVRSYARVRAGEEVNLPARRVTVASFDVLGVRRPATELIDVDVAVTCSTGTYIRSLARDLGHTLNVGGHLTALRRTRVGGFPLAAARTLEQLETDLEVIPLADAVRQTFPARVVDGDEAAGVRHGRPLATAGESGLIGVFDADGAVLALMEPRGEVLKVVVGFTGG
ncbi:MAG TPA: tRNA pseudouridine(55) synthase TruB [Actinomycetes bacterium]|nr:tRNA pseudouridine(55) synthase TruB [Actinomycetes bacterium]